MSDGSDVNHCVMNLAEEELKYSSGRLTCKFMLIRFQERTWLVFGPLQRYPYHANLVSRFCSEFRIACAYERHPDICEIYDPEVETRGGGYLEIDPARRKVVASGRSTAYGAFEKRELAAVLGSGGIFEGYRADIRAR